MNSSSCTRRACGRSAAWILAAALLFGSVPARAVSQDWEEGYAAGLRAAGAGIVLIEPEAYDYVLNLNKRKVHKAGKSCTKEMLQANTAYFAGTAEELRAALEQLGWIEEYGDCGQCRPRVLQGGEE